MVIASFIVLGFAILCLGGAAWCAFKVDEMSTDARWAAERSREDAASAQKALERIVVVEARINQNIALYGDDDLFRVLGRGWEDDPTCTAPQYQRGPTN